MRKGYQEWRCAICDETGEGEFPSEHHEDCYLVAGKLREIADEYWATRDRIIEKAKTDRKEKNSSFGE